MTDANLIDAFVAEFTKGDPSRLFREFSLPDGVEPADVEPLLIEPWDEDGSAIWRPVRFEAPADALTGLYQSVPGPLPPLYERLIGSYHFGAVELESLRLLPNFPPPFDGLFKALTSDDVIFRVLSSQGFVQLGKGPDVNYDPVCFDLSRRSPDGDCVVVRFDHEEILIHERLRIVAVLADSFRQLVYQTIDGRLAT